MAELMSSQEENSEQMLHPHVGVKKKKKQERNIVNMTFGKLINCIFIKTSSAINILYCNQPLYCINFMRCRLQ